MDCTATVTDLWQRFSTFAVSLHCFGEEETLQMQREIVDSSRISSCRMRGGERDSQEKLSKPWPRSFSLKYTQNWHLISSQTYINFTTCFYYDVLVFHACAWLEFTSAPKSLCFSSTSLHTHTAHTVKTLTLQLDRKSCGDNHWPPLWAFWLKLCWSQKRPGKHLQRIQQERKKE